MIPVSSDGGACLTWEKSTGEGEKADRLSLLPLKQNGYSNRANV
jgi:hypothetical protein